MNFKLLLIALSVCVAGLSCKKEEPSAARPANNKSARPAAAAAPPFRLVAGQPILHAGERLGLPLDMKTEETADGTIAKAERVAFIAAGDNGKEYIIAPHGADSIRLKIEPTQLMRESVRLVTAGDDGKINKVYGTTSSFNITPPGCPGALWIDQPYDILDAREQVIYSSPQR